MNEVHLVNNYEQGYVSVGIKSLHATHRADMARPGIHPLKFPATRNILWDHQHTGPSSTLHIYHYRNPVVIIEEKTLRILQRFSQECNSDTYRCLLIGSLTVDYDGCGVIISVDRLESCQGRSDDELTLSRLVPGDVSIPCVVKKNCAKPSTSVEHYENSISLLCERCIAKSKVDVSHFIALRANCSYHSNNQKFIFHIDFDMVATMLSFKASPINPVAIVPTALSKHLTGPLALSEIQGEPKSGYLTMDNTRKLLLVLETDPKINSLPLVGIWISGLANIQDPFVWASCLRYLFNKTLQERICVPPEPFLIVLYSPLHSKPEFYECVPSGGESTLDFSLSTCHEVLQLSKDYVGQADTPVEMELIKVEHGEKKNIFDVALKNTESRRLSTMQKTKTSEGKQSDSMDDITPRNRPAPHITKVPTVKPSVPEVSLLLDETAVEESSPSSGTKYNNRQPPSERLYPEPAPDLPRTSVLEQRTAASGLQYAYVNYRPPHLPQQVPQQVLCDRQMSTSRPCRMPQPNPGCPNPPGCYQVRSSLSPCPQPNQECFASNFSSYPEANYVPYPRTNFPSYPGPNPRQQLGANFIPKPGGDPGANFPCYPGAYSSQQPRASFLPYPGANLVQYPAPSIAPSPVQNPGQHPGVNCAHRPVGPRFNLEYAPCPNPGDKFGHHSARSPVPNTSNSGYHSGFSHSAANSVPQSEINERKFIDQGRQTVGYQQAPVQSSSTRHVESSSSVVNAETVHRRIPRNNPCVKGSGSCDSLPAGETQHSNFAPNHTKSHNVSNHDVETKQYEGHQGKQQHQLPREQLMPMASPGMPHVHSQYRNDIQTSSPGCNSGSTDSGLHSNDSADSGSHLDHLMMSSFGPVPQEVYARLQQQDEQLKQLQEQLARLLAKQNSSVHDASVNTQSESTRAPFTADGGDSAKERCSVAVNTTLVWPNPDQSPADHDSSTQPQQQHTNETDLQQRQQQQQSLPNSSSPQQANQGYSCGHRQFPSPIQQCNGAMMSNDSLSLGEFQLTCIQDATEESIVSDMVVDLPDYTSWSPEKTGGNTSGYPETDSNESPMFGESVSMYEQPSANDKVSQDVCGAPDGMLLANNQRKFYENLIGNVQKLLAKHADDDSGQKMAVSDSGTSVHSTSANTSSVNNAMETQVTEQDCPGEDRSIDVAEITRRRLKELGVDLDDCHSNDTTNTFRSDQSFYLNSLLLPKVNYVSMMFESGDSDLSHDANALAMKYLSDEQLSALALHQGSPGRPNGRHPCLDRIANSIKTDVSLCGISSNHMSFATRKYLERYGLIGDTEEAKEERCAEEPVLRDHPALANVQQYLRKLNDRSLSSSASSQSDDKRQTSGGKDHDNRLQHPHEQARYRSDGESFSSEYTSSVHSHPSGPARPATDKFDQTPTRAGFKTKKPPCDGSPKPDCEPPQYDIYSNSPIAGARVLDIERLRRLPKLL